MPAKDKPSSLCSQSAMGKKGKSTFAHCGSQTTYRPVKAVSTQTMPGHDIDAFETTCQTLAKMDTKQIATMLGERPDTCKKIQSAIAMMSSAKVLVQQPNSIIQAPQIVLPQAPAPEASVSTIMTYYQDLRAYHRRFAQQQ